MASAIDKGWRPASPPLQGRGKGWGLSHEQLATLQLRARAMRNDAPEPERSLWRHLSNSQLGGFKFRRQQVVGRTIVDFLCPAAKLAVEVDGETHADPVRDRQRDAYLRSHGLTVLHVTNAEVMQNMEGVPETILAALRENSPHPNPSPEGEGL